jgi:hypothetical protein
LLHAAWLPSLQALYRDGFITFADNVLVKTKKRRRIGGALI